MHSPSPDFTITKLGTPRGGSDWRTMLELAEKPDYPHPALMRQLEGAMADLGPRDLDAPEMLTRLAAVRGLSVTAKERLVRLSMKACAEHVSDKAWNNAMRDIVDTRIGRMMLQKRDSGFVEAYANLVLKTAIGYPVNPTKAVNSLPLAMEAEGIARAELGRRSTNKAIRGILRASWAQEERDGKKERERLMRMAAKNPNAGDPVLVFFRNLGPIGKLLNVAVLTGMLSGMLPATASAGFTKKGTAVAEREADNPARVSKPRVNPVAPAPGDAVAPQAPAPVARERVEVAPAKPTPAGTNTGKGLDKVLKPKVELKNGDNDIVIRADSGVNVPSSPSATKNGKVTMPAITPSASVSVNNGSVQADFDFISQLKLGGMDPESAWSMGVALAYIDAMQESGVAVRAVYDDEDGFKDIAARLGLSVGERGQFIVTAGMKQGFVNEVSKLVTSGDPQLRTRLRQFAANIAYSYQNAEDPAELLQDLFVIATYAHQPGEDLGKIGTYRTDDWDEISEWNVHAQYLAANKFQVELGLRLQINKWLDTEIQAGASITDIEAWFEKKAKQIISPVIGGSLRASLAGGWEFVIEARGEKDIASVGTAVEYTHQGLTASIGVEARKDGREKTVDIRPGVKFKATDKALADLVSGEKTAEAKPRRDEARAYRLDFARMMKFPQRNRFEIDPHRTFDEHGVRAIAVKKWVFAEIERNPDGSNRSGLIALNRPLDAIALLSLQEYAEYFEVAGDKLRVYFRSDRGARDGKPLPPGAYRLGLAEKDSDYSVAQLDVTAGSSLYQLVPQVVNDIPADLYQEVVAGFVRNPSITIADVKEAVAEAITLPDISSMAFSEVTIGGAALSLAAEHAAGGVAHVAVIRDKKLTDEEIRAISLEAIKSGKVGEYSAVPLDVDGKAKISVKSDVDGVDITVVAIAENAAHKVSKEAEGTTVTLPSLAGFASVPKCEAVFNTLTAACSATVTKTDATVHVAYFAEPLKDLSDAARVRDAAGAVTSVDFATSSMAGAGKVTFKEAGTYYGYAVTVNANGLSKAAVALGTVVIAATREAPSVSSLQCDANAETCAIATDTPGARVSIAIKDSPITFTATADDQGVAKIDYAKKLTPGSYEFVITLKHPTEDRISRTDTRTVRIVENPAPALVGEQAISGVTTTSYHVSGQASKNGDVYVLSLPASDPDATKISVEAVVARGKKSALAQDGTKWVYDVVVDGRSPSTDYVTLTVFQDSKGKLSTIYRKDAKTADVPNSAPTHSSSVGSVTATSMVISFESVDPDKDEVTNYWMVLPKGAKAPTIEQLITGKDADGNPVALSGNTKGDSASVTWLTPEEEYVKYSAAQDPKKATSEMDKDEFSTTKVPNTAPEHTLTISEVTYQSAKFTFGGVDAQGDKITRYYVILPATAKAPSVEQVLARKDADGKPVTLSGSTTEASVVATGLTDNTAYKVYSVGSDGKLESALDIDDLHTEKVPNTAPEHTLTISEVTYQSAKFTFGGVDAQGDKITRYYVILPIDSKAPTAEQIMAGKDADGKPVTLSGKTEESTVTVLGLLASTGYAAYSLGSDGKLTSKIDKDELTTLAKPNSAPTHSSSVGSVTATSMVISFVSVDPDKDEVTNYWMVLPKGAKAPTIEQLITGKDADGNPVALSGNTKGDSASVTWLTPEEEYVKYSAAQDPKKATSEMDKDEFSTTKVPNTAPTYSLTTSNLTYQSVKLNFGGTDAEGDPITRYWVVLPAGSTTPSIAQIKLGQNASGQAVARSGSTTDASATVSNLDEQQSYDIYSVSSDGKLDSASEKDTVTTPERPNTAPTHSLTVSDVTYQSAKFTFGGVDAQGDKITRYYVILPAGATAPSPEQIIEGKDASGHPVALSGNTENTTVTVSGLSESTTYEAHSVSRDTRSAISLRDTDTFTTEAIPNSAPSHTASLTSVTHDTAVVGLTNVDPNPTDTVTTYYVLLPAAALAPTAAQIRAGQDSTGATAAIKGNTTGVSLTLSSLSASTSYRLHSIANDGQASSAVSSISITTEAPPNSPPTFSASVTATTHSTATIAFTSSDDHSTVRHYYVVLPAAAPAPSIAQVLAGQDSTGATASIRGNTTSATANITGLSASTGYKIYSLWVENDGTLTSALDTDAFTTEAPPNNPPTFSTSIVSVTDTGAVLWFTSSDDHSTVRHYYVVLPASASAPTIGQVLAGQDSTGATASIRGNTTSATANITGLSEHTAYNVYSVGKENDGTLTSALDTDALTTLYTAVTDAPSTIAIGGGSLLTNDTTPTVTAAVPANAVSMQVRVTTVGGTVISDWSSTDVTVSSGTASWTPSTPLAEPAGVANSRYIVTWRGVDGNGTPGPTAALAGAGIDIRTSGPGSLTSWGEAPSTVPTQQSTEYTKIFDAPNGFGGTVSNLSCTAPLGGSVSSCTYDADSDKITVVFTTPAQAGFRLVVSGNDAYGASFSKLQNASGLSPLVPTTSPANFEISTASDANADGRIGTLTPTLTADLPTGATHLRYSIDGGSWTAVADGDTGFTPTLTVGSHTIRVVWANTNGQAADSTAVSMTLDVRTDWPGTLPSWGDGSIAPTQQSTQYTTSFTAPDGFGGSVTNLSVTAPLGGTINSAQYNSTTGKIDVTYTTPAQAGFRLALSYTDAYEVTKTKTQIVSNLAALVPTASPTNFALDSGIDLNDDGKINVTSVGLSATLPTGATHLSYRVGSGSWTDVTDGQASFTVSSLAEGNNTIQVVGANANWRAADSTAVSMTLDVRTAGPGTLPTWGDDSVAPTKRSTEYTKTFSAPNGFGGAVSNLSCTAPLGGSVSSCTYDADSDKITVVFTTPAQAGFRLVVSGNDAYGASFSKLQNASGLTS